MHRFIPTVIVITVLPAMGYQFMSTQQANAQKAVMTKGEVQAIVKEYLVEEPQIIIDALEAYRDQQEKEVLQKSEKAIKENREALLKNSAVPAIGPENADVTIVEFFDYRCGYCKRMLPVISELLNEDKNVRVVFHELPILSEDSKLAAKASLAVFEIKPEKYFDYHSVLMQTKGSYTRESLTKLAIEHGVDKAKFTAALASKKLDTTLEASAKVARDIGISGTPAFIVGNELVPGAISLQQLKERVAKARSGKK